MHRPGYVLPFIVLAQFAGTSLWFAGNAVLPDPAFAAAWNLAGEGVGISTAAVQIGFILGTFVFAFFAISDRFSPAWTFWFCALGGALANLGIVLFPDAWRGLMPLLTLRFVTGFCLAGIYPVGMKIAAGWYEHGLGRALGYLVGALVLGTAFPYLLRFVAGQGAIGSWSFVLAGVSGIAALGGFLILWFVPDGPHLPRSPAAFDPRSIVAIFSSKDFRAAAFGYFGHMWELYAFWAFLPALLAAYGQSHGLQLDVALWSFMIIAAGFLGCAFGGDISARLRERGSARVAFAQLLCSGTLCLLSPFLFDAPAVLFLGMLLLWGVCVVGDSPQFSALSAATAPRDRVGSALTIVTSLGFAITIGSIALIDAVRAGGLVTEREMFVVLGLGPIFGLLALRRLV